MNTILKLIAATIGIIVILILLPFTAQFFVIAWLLVLQFGADIAIGATAIACFGAGLYLLDESHRTYLAKKELNANKPQSFKTVLRWFFNENAIAAINFTWFAGFVASFLSDVRTTQADIRFTGISMAVLFTLCLLIGAYIEHRSLSKSSQKSLT